MEEYNTENKFLLFFFCKHENSIKVKLVSFGISKETNLINQESRAELFRQQIGQNFPKKYMGSL